MPVRGRRSSAAYALNRYGTVVGSSYDDPPSFRVRASRWRNGKATDLGVLAGMDESRAFGINDRGDVLGESYGSEEAEDEAFLWRKGTMKDLGRYTEPSDGTAGLAINDSGTIISQAQGLWQHDEGRKAARRAVDAALRARAGSAVGWSLPSR